MSYALFVCDKRSVPVRRARRRVGKYKFVGGVLPQPFSLLLLF